MSKRVLCKFFAHGACLKGEHCEFSHDWKDPANNVCTFYQKGACAYGSRCRYDHVKVSRPQSSAASSSAYTHQYLVSDSVPAAYPSESASVSVTPVPAFTGELSASSRPFLPPNKPAWSENFGQNEFVDNDIVGESRSTNPMDLPICSFAAAGNCPRGEKCPHIHGDLCPTCRKQCLHPFRPDEREEHIKACEKKQQHLEALKHSQEIECSVCLERVLSKSTAAERKFGLLSECDHPFCISCIRNWRSSSPTSGMDVNSALRACPICRKLSYFVIPSVIWYSTKEEKQEIVDSYKAKLRSIDCKHFDFGNGTCPFGTSCFYKHTVKLGSYLWNSSLGVDSFGPSFPDVHEDGSDTQYSSDDVDMDRLCDLFNNLYGSRGQVGLEELENQIDDDSEDESSGDDLAYAYLAAEARAFSQMPSGFDASEIEELENDSDDDLEDESSGDVLADAYVLAEAMAFVQMFRNE